MPLLLSAGTRATYRRGAPVASASREDGASSVDALIAEFLVDSQKLVVLAHAIGSRHRTGLDLSGICRNREIGNECVFAFTRTMRDDDAVRCLSRHIDGIQGFGERTDLIDLNKDCIRDAHSHAAREPFRVGDKQIVADELYLPA